jgi:EpsI family protein
MQDSVPTLRNTWLSAGLIGAAVLVYWPSTAALWNFWIDDNFGGTHGLIVAPLAAWLLFSARYRLAAVEVRPSWVARGLLLIASLAWLVFWRAGIQELHLLMLPVLMGLAVWAAMGFQAALCVAFPIGYLYFAVPAWGIFGGPLQDLTVRAVGVLAPLIDVPVQIHGDLLVLPGVGKFEVERSCSGVNFLAIGLAVAALLGEVERASLLRRVLLVAAMGTLAVVANWIRVLVIVDAGYTTHMRHVLVSRSHYMFGWVLFATVMVSFVWLLARPQARLARPATTSQGLLRTTAWSACALAVVALVAMPLLVYTVVTRLDVSAGPLAFTPPGGLGGWAGPLGERSNPWKPDFVGPHSQWSYAYQGPAGQSIEMVAIGYPMQAQGRELVNEENALFGASVNMDTVTESTVTLGQESYIETVVADPTGHRSLVWSVYDIGGREFVTPLLSQLWYGVRSLGGPPYSVLFAFRTPCESSCDTARDTLRSFAQNMGAAFFQSVTRTLRSPAHAQTDRLSGFRPDPPLTALSGGDG